MLVVGHVSEPRVAFDRPSLSFGKVLIGGQTHATVNLLNSEHMPFHFDLDKASYDASPARLESTGLPQLILSQLHSLVRCTLDKIVPDSIQTAVTRDSAFTYCLLC